MADFLNLQGKPEPPTLNTAHPHCMNLPENFEFHILIDLH